MLKEIFAPKSEIPGDEMDLGFCIKDEAMGWKGWKKMASPLRNGHFGWHPIGGGSVFVMAVLMKCEKKKSKHGIMGGSRQLIFWGC